MSGKSLKPGPGQLSSPELEAPFRERDLTEQSVFAKVADPHFWQIDPSAYADIDPEMLEAVSPDNLQAAFVGIKRNAGPFVQGYTKEGDNKERYVRVFPAENKILSNTYLPHKYGEAATASFLSGKRAGLMDFDTRSRVAVDEKFKAVEAKLQRMAKHRERQLQPERDGLTRLLEAAEHPNLQRRNEGDTRIVVVSLREWMLPQVLETLAMAKGWDAQQLAEAKRAMDVRFFLVRDHNQHLTYWQDIIRFFRDLDDEKIALFGDREARFLSYLVQNGRDPR